MLVYHREPRSRSSQNVVSAFTMPVGEGARLVRRLQRRTGHQATKASVCLLWTRSQCACAIEFRHALTNWLGWNSFAEVGPYRRRDTLYLSVICVRRMMMGWSFFALAVALVLGAFGLVMNHNGRKADRERENRGRPPYDGN